MSATRAGGKTRAEKIAAVVRRIAASGGSVAAYFQRHKVPFSRAQYFRYRARLMAEGSGGLVDRRQKIIPEVEHFVLCTHRDQPELSLREIGEAAKRSLGVAVSHSTVARLLERAGEVISWPRPQEPERLAAPHGGFEIVAALALHLGWVEHTGEVLAGAVARFRRTVGYRQQRVGKDRQGRREGRFTAAYNRRRDVRQQRFASIEEKRRTKNYSRMEVFEVSRFILERKCLAILALPLITLNGSTRSADDLLGNALEHFCGFNYRQHTLDKFLREWKYLGVAEELLREQVGFWQEHWRKLGEKSELPFLCYYVDGNTKALWSQKRVKQNKVTMLGRVMGCLEQVFVHDGCGHPIYLQTYAGKAPMGEQILGLMEEIEEALEGPGPALPVRRVMVMDAASNSVRTLRAFAGQERYFYITALDDNQWRASKIREQGRAQRYAYGAATLRDCQMELEDSQEKGYLIEVRAVRIDWDYGKTTVLITGLPREMVRASLVVKAYFERWPQEELQFRGMKAFACLNRVAGYGKQKLVDENAQAKRKKAEEQIRTLRQKLQAPLRVLADQEERLALSLEKQRRIHARCPIVDGKRTVAAEQRARLAELRREIARCRREMKLIKRQWSKDLRRLEKHEKEWLRLQGKDFVYQIDVELDQIMAYFRISLVNICCWFLKHCMSGSSMTLAKLLHRVLLMPAEIELTSELRRVTLQGSAKDPEGMNKLKLALKRLNALGIKDLDHRRIEFTLV